MSMSTKSRRRQRAFTLVEMSIAVALFGLILLMTIPNVVARLPIYRLDSAADRIMIHLHGARMRAMSEGQYVAFRFESGAKVYSFWATPDRSGASAGGPIDEHRISDLKGVAFQCYPEQGLFRPSGIFSPIGSVSGQIFWIWIYADGTHEQRSVVIWPSGQVSIFKYS